MGRGDGGQAAQTALKRRAETVWSPPGFDPVKLTPGQVDDDAISVYINGQCAFFALALNDTIEGGEIIAGFEGNGEGALAATPDHFAVMVDDNTVYDIEGEHSFDEWLERHEFDEAITYSREEVKLWQKEHQRRDQWPEEKSEQEQYELAKTFAETIAKENELKRL